MTEQITTTQLLDFLVKTDKIFASVTFNKRDEGYEIGVYCRWDDDDFYTQKTFISKEGCSNWDWETSDYDFFTMSDELDRLVKQGEQEKIKMQKREELLSRLTDEEKELLGM